MTFWDPENLKTIAAGRWLQRPSRSLPIEGVGTDTREPLTGRVFVALRGERFDGHRFLHIAAEAGAGLLIIESELPPKDLPQNIGVLLVDSAKKALARLALAYRRTLRGTKVIALAGSAGKTTTKKLIDAALRGSMQGTISPKSFNNDIGVPYTILNARLNDKYIVVEVGTNNLGEVANLSAMIEPDIAVITMIGREHLQGLISLEHIAQENAALLGFLRPGGVAVLNADAPLMQKCARHVPHVVWFGESADADVRLTARGADGERWWFEANDRVRFDLSLPGKHNAVNALAAVAVARRLGVSDADISRRLKHAEGAPMRSAIQRITTDFGSVLICNDAYNANPESMAASLDTFAEVAGRAKRRVVILGDMLELGDNSPELHREVGRHVLAINAKTPIGLAIFIGDQSRHAADEVLAHWPFERVQKFPELNETIASSIAAMIRPDDAVLLKGSRGMGLERLVPAIERYFSDAAFRKRQDERNAAAMTAADAAATAAMIG